MDNKERILHAARELFGTLGFADTTYKRIAQHLGIAEGLIAHYFGNKDNLFVAVQTRILQDLSERMAEGEFYAHHGLSMLLNQAKALLRASQDPQSGCRALLRCSPLFSLEHQSPDERLLACCQAMIQRVLAAIARGQEDGSIRRTLEPTLAASVFFATVFGAIRARLLTPAHGILGIEPGDGFYAEILTILERYFSASSSSERDGAMR
jgi:AcrR family transcriptional regulator